MLNSRKGSPVVSIREAKYIQIIYKSIRFIIVVWEKVQHHLNFSVLDVNQNYNYRLKESKVKLHDNKECIIYPCSQYHRTDNILAF